MGTLFLATHVAYALNGGSISYGFRDVTPVACAWMGARTEKSPTLT